MSHLTLATASGEQHGLVNIIANSVPPDDFKLLSPENKKRMEAEKKEDARIVKAEYMNSRGNHERLTMPYCKYAGDPIQMWNFIPNKVYDVPLGLVKQVNDKNKIMKQRAGLVSVDDVPLKKDSSPLEYDIDGNWLHKFSAVGF